MHGRQRLPRHPRHAGRGPPRRPLGHLSRGRVRRPRLPRRRPGQRAGLAVVRGVRRRHAARRAQRRGARPRAHARPAHRPALPAHRLRGRRRPPHPAGDAALRVGGRPAHVRAARGDHACEPRRRDHGRERPRRPSAQPRTAAGLPRGHHVPAGDALGEVGAHPPPRPHGAGGRRGRRLPGDAHDRERHHARLRGDDPASVDPPGAGSRRRTSASSGGPSSPAGRCGWTSSCASARRATSTAARVQRGLPRRARRGPVRGLRRDRRRERRRVGAALGRTATSRSTATRRAPRPCASGSTTC